MKQAFLTFMRGAVQGKTRVVLSWIFLLPIPFLSQQKLWWPGLVCLGAGCFIRGWASGFIFKDNELATVGPYALCRNPLYFGSFLLGTGAALVIQSWIFLVLHSLAFLLIYGFIIEFEEKRLTGFFGERFIAYCKTTPRFFPILPNIKRIFSGGFRWSQFLRNKGFEAVFTAAGILVLIEVTARFPWKLVNLLTFK